MLSKENSGVEACLGNRNGLTPPQPSTCERERGIQRWAVLF